MDTSTPTISYWLPGVIAGFFSLIVALVEAFLNHCRLKEQRKIILEQESKIQEIKFEHERELQKIKNKLEKSSIAFSTIFANVIDVYKVLMEKSTYLKNKVVYLHPAYQSENASLSEKKQFFDIAFLEASNALSDYEEFYENNIALLYKKVYLEARNLSKLVSIFLEKIEDNLLEINYCGESKEIDSDVNSIINLYHSNMVSLSKILDNYINVDE